MTPTEAQKGREMKYSIITATLNTLECTVKCFKSIFENTEDFELIVVDNASTDGTVGYLKEMQAQHENMKMIYLDKAVKFAPANNIGIKLAEGKHVVFLSNDTVVSKGWLERLCAHLYNIPLKSLAMVGPVTGNSNGKQMVGLQDPEAWYQEHKGRWISVGKLFGWCMLIKKDVLDEIGGFDERFENAYEDNDLCLRLYLAGYKMAIAYDTYVYHAGQSTLRNLINEQQYIENGLKNRELFYDKWYDPRPRKLVAVYRTNGGKWLEESLKQTSKFADSIVIHFCRARKNVNEERHERLLKDFPKIAHTEFYDGIFQEDYERGRLLEIALEMHTKGEADWCISIDDDEIYEDKFVGLVQKMMCSRNPEVMGYWYQWRTIWERRGDEEYWRTDGIFGKFTNYRFFRLIKGQEISSEHPEGHHCGSAPLIPDDSLKWCNIRVKHLGYDTHEQRQKKFDFYQNNDHFKTKADIGNEDYSHLIDANVTLERYIPDNGISLIMMVRNEEECILTSLENIAPIIDEFVIIDTGSTDGTKAILEKFAKYSPVPVKILDFPWQDNFSTPRNFAKSHATQRWILMLDADERFEYHDLCKILMISESEAEAVIFHVINYMQKTGAGEKPIYASTQAIRLFRNIPEFFFTGLLHETVEDSLGALQIRRKVNIGMSPVVLHHYGYLRQKNRVKEKFEYYVELNNRQIEITDEKDPRPYFNLALHWMQEGKNKEAVECFTKALELNPRFWHANAQMAALNIQSAKEFLTRVLDSIPENHPFKNETEELLKYLETHSFGHLRLEI
jgi:GT2 family glycosyltransferase